MEHYRNHKCTLCVIALHCTGVPNEVATECIFVSLAAKCSTMLQVAYSVYRTFFLKTAATRNEFEQAKKRCVFFYGFVSMT